MRPLATILLDTPGSAGPVRGVILYRPDRGVLYVLDPRTEEPHRETPVADLDDALRYTADAWGEVRVQSGQRVWDLQWLCEEPEDFAP